MPPSSFDVISHKHWKTRTATLKSRHRHTDSQCSQCSQCSCRNIAVMWSHSRAQTVHDAYIQNASLSRPPSATVVSTEPFSHGTGTLRCLQKKNGDLQTLICVLAARLRRCPTLSNSVLYQHNLWFMRHVYIDRYKLVGCAHLHSWW